jgi:surface protein
MKEMFFGYRDYALFNHPSISNWDVSNVQNFEGMFKRNDVFNQPLNNWNTGSATNMSYMFGSDTSQSDVAFNQPIGAWDVSNVTNAFRMFYDNPNFNQNLSNWTFPAGVDMSYMFAGVGSSFAGIGGVAGLGINGPSNIEGAFFYCRNFTGAGLASWDVSNCSSFYRLFYFNDSINADLSGWNTQNLTTMQDFISYASGAVLNINWTSCPNLTNMQNAFTRIFNSAITADQLDTSNVTNMQGIFVGARGAAVDVSSWDTSSVTNMNIAFAGSRNAADTTMAFVLSAWDVSNVLSMQSIFGEDDGETYNPTEKITDISSWVLHPNVDLGIFTTNPFYDTTLGRRAAAERFGNENYGKLLAGWANTIKNQADPPVQKSFNAGGEQYTGTVHFAASEFTTAAEGRAWLTTNFQVTVTSASNADANGDYLWNAATQSFVNGLGWYFIKDGANWKLFDAADALQSTGTEDVNYPWQVTTWSSVLSGATLDFSGAGWTITDGGLAP